MKTVLVTGGAGFIGSHLCAELLKRGKYVICLDNFFTGSNRNIQGLIGNKNFEVMRHDIIQPIFLEVDEIYNLACPASPVHYQFDPIKTLLTSTVGMFNMLGIAKRCRAKILQASTSEVYGNAMVHPQPETYWGNVNCLGPRACYDEGKRVAETFMVDYFKENKVNIRLVRIFNTYGPHMAKDDGRVISNFIVQALLNKPLTVYGDGSHTRSFCYVADMVDGFIRMMENREDFIGPVNLGNPEEISIAALAKKIIALAGSSSTIEFRELPEDDPERRNPDISLAKKKLTWQPTTPLESGLKKTIAYFKETL
ncbi:SDR family oxidoreductase [Candidatus Woesearchaeota archaeon]|nr:SDR family oxidoreductase [Candidatus Woesearchaeota archaeon]